MGQPALLLIGVAANAIVIFSLAMVFFVIVEGTIGNRVPAEVEWSCARSLLALHLANEEDAHLDRLQDAVD